MPTGSEQKDDAIISGSSPVEGVTVSVQMHRTPDFDKWYEGVFAPAWEGINAGEIGGEAERSVIRYIVLRDEKDGIAVLTVFPSEQLPGTQSFYDQDLNPLWKQGREEGWLTGTFKSFYFTPTLFRGAKEGPPPPHQEGKGMLFGGAKLGIAYAEFTQTFTSPEFDELHSVYGVESSVTGPVAPGSLAYSAKLENGSVGVVHFHETPEQAAALSKLVSEHTEEPFKSAVSSGIFNDIFAYSFTVVKDVERFTPH